MMLLLVSSLTVLFALSLPLIWKTTTRACQDPLCPCGKIKKQ